MTTSMNNKEIKLTLIRFGLSEPEVTVYLLLTKGGLRTAGAISKITGLKRGQTYNILESLLSKELIHVSTTRGVKHFSTYSPDTLLDILKSQQNELEGLKNDLVKAVPLLKNFDPGLLSPSNVKFFRGIEGVKALYEDTLLNMKNETIYALGDFDTSFPKDNDLELHNWIWKYADRRASKNIYYFGIVNKSKSSDIAFKTRIKQKRKLKMLTGVDLPAEINIYKNKIAIMSSAKEMVGLLIEDQFIAQTLMNFHKSVWGLLPDYK